MHPEGNTPNNQSQCHTDQPTPGRAESHEAGVSSLGVSATTQSLIDLLRRRDAAGRAKYGTTLDRTDLTGAEWTQHAVEELLDAAGYLLSRQRTDDQASAPVGVEVASLPALWRQREDNGEERTEFDKGYEQASDECAEALERALAKQPTPPGPVTAKFTDSARAAIAWVLYHHQGAKSPVGQPLRYALGLGRHEPLSDFQIAEAQAWAAWANATTADFHRQQQGDQA